MTLKIDEAEFELIGKEAGGLAYKRLTAAMPDVNVRIIFDTSRLAGERFAADLKSGLLANFEPPTAEGAKTMTKTVRKLAREAVVFGLLAIPLAFVIMFAVLYFSGELSKGSIDDLFPFLAAGVYVGFPGGVGIWIVYRVLRFAVKG